MPRSIMATVLLTSLTLSNSEEVDGGHWVDSKVDGADEAFLPITADDVVSIGEFIDA